MLNHRNHGFVQELRSNDRQFATDRSRTAQDRERMLEHAR
jgi:hypothetical protein